MREHLITMVRALIRDRMRVNMSSWRQHFSASIPRQNLSNFYKSFRCFANGLRPTKSVSLIIALNLVTACCGFWQIMVKLIPAQIYSSQGNESFPAYCTFYSSNSFVKQPWQSEMPKLPIASYKGDLKAVISTAHNCLPKPTRCFEFQLKDGQASRLASLVSCTGHFCILLTQLSQPAPWYRMFEANSENLETKRLVMDLCTFSQQSWLLNTRKCSFKLAFLSKKLLWRDYFVCSKGDKCRKSENTFRNHKMFLLLWSNSNSSKVICL